MSVIMETNIDWGKITYFDPMKDKMICCPCCETAYVDREFIETLRDARKLAGVPFVINSMCRCFNYDRKLKKRIGKSFTGTSSHLFTHDKRILTCAADISAKTNSMRFKIVSGLIKAGFKRILIYENFIHVDNDRSKVQNIMMLA